MHCITLDQRLEVRSHKNIRQKQMQTQASSPASSETASAFTTVQRSIISRWGARQAWRHGGTLLSLTRGAVCHAYRRQCLALAATLTSQTENTLRWNPALAATRECSCDGEKAIERSLLKETWRCHMPGRQKGHLPTDWLMQDRRSG